MSSPRFDADQRFVLADGVVVLTYEELSPEQRERSGCTSKEVLLSRRESRAGSQVLDQGTRGLVSFFQTPRTITDGIRALATELGHDSAHELLDQTYPALQQLVRSRLLVPEDERNQAPLLKPGADVAGFEVRECIASMEDVEVYKGTCTATSQPVAIKLARRRQDNPSIMREAELLSACATEGVQRHLATGHHHGKAFLVSSWMAGDSLRSIAHALHLGAPGCERTKLARILVAIARRYARLHEDGFLHGDVHPGNIILSGSTVCLIDFGSAIRLAGVETARCAGVVPFFADPETAASLLDSTRAHSRHPLDEQFSLAAVLYWLASGQHYARFPYDREGLLRTVIGSPPRSFTEAGSPPWPTLETVLHRALAKRRSERFASTQDFASALSEATKDGVSLPPRAPASSWANKWFLSLRESGPAAYPEQDHFDVMAGKAGVAYALYLEACRKDSPDALSAADLWITDAVAELDAGGPAPIEEVSCTAANPSPHSLFFGSTGVHAVQALVANALGDRRTEAEAIAGFERACLEDYSRTSPELLFGYGGVVLGAALLRSHGIELGRSTTERVNQLVSDIEQATVADVARRLGVAHGFAGLCYVALLWRAGKSGDEKPAHPVLDSLRHLISLAEPHGPALRWPVRAGGDSSVTWWCNGTAGMIHVLCAAYELTGASEFAGATRGAIEHLLRNPSSNLDICCGLAGNAYALFRAADTLREPELARRAAQCASSAASLASARSDLSWGLYKGVTGIANLCLQIEVDERPRQPFFSVAP